MKLCCFQPSDIGELAFAIYRGKRAAFRSPAHRAYFAEKDIPAIPEGDRRVYFFENPLPHLAARNRFSLGKCSYTLYSLLPLHEEAEAYPEISEDDTPIRPVRDLFSVLLSHKERGTVSPGASSVIGLFQDCCDAIRRGITDALDIKDNGKAAERDTVTLAREGLMLSLGIAIPHLERGGRINAVADRNAEGDHTFRFLADGTVKNAFLRRFILAVAEACDFSVDFLPNGICFTLKAGHPASLTLRASLPESDSYAIALGLLLSSVA